jgi:hypothetical protein
MIFPIIPREILGYDPEIDYGRSVKKILGLPTPQYSLIIRRYITSAVGSVLLNELRTV